MRTPTVDQLVALIAHTNRAWKIFRTRKEGPVARALRDRKSALQLELLRTHPDVCSLVRDDRDGHALYSIRLLRPVRLPGGAVLHDAMHLPVELVSPVSSDPNQETHP